jgi:hypothetical protein
MTKAIPAVLALAFSGAFGLSAPAHAEETDRALLSSFCDPARIKGSTCKRAKFYPNAGHRACDATLTKDRYSGKFLASGNPLLIVSYESGCETHATDGGGAVLFEQMGGTYAFRGFQPGMQTNDCVTLAGSKRQDLLICLTGHMGQGDLETGVAQVVFTEDPSKHIAMSLDFLVTAEDTNGAYGSNVVACKERSKYFELSKLSVGPQPNTVTVEASYADAETIRTACGTGFPKPKETFGDLPPGDAYVPEGYEKRGKMTIDLAGRNISLQ